MAEPRSEADTGAGKDLCVVNADTNERAGTETTTVERAQCRWERRELGAGAVKLQCRSGGGQRKERPVRGYDERAGVSS